MSGFSAQLGEKSKKKAEEHHLNNVSVSFSATAPHPPIPNPTSLPPRFILTSPWEESATIYCNTQHALHTQSTLTPHVCAHTRARSPSCPLNWGKAEILLGWISKWTSIEFPAVFHCDIVCPNIVHLEWKGMVLHGKHYFKGHCCYFGWISMFLSDFDPIQHYCMGLISENKGYSPRRGLILACIPWCRQKGTSTRCVSVLLCAFCRAESFSFYLIFFVLYGKIASCILTRKAWADLVHLFL